MHEVARKALLLSFVTGMLGLIACQKSGASKLNGTQVSGSTTGDHLALGSGYTRAFETFMNQKETCLTGETIFVPNPEISISHSQDMTLDESMKELFVGSGDSIGGTWDFLVAKGKAQGVFETSLNMLSKGRRVVLFTQVDYRAGSMFLKNLQWNEKTFPLDHTAKEILALSCGEEALTRVDLGSSIIVAFDFVANSDILSQKLKAYVAGEIKVAGKSISKKVSLFDGYLMSSESFDASVKIYARQVGGSIGAFEVINTQDNGETKECPIHLSARSTDQDIAKELDRCLKQYTSLIDYVKSNYRQQLKEPHDIYAVNPSKALSSYAPLKYYFEDYRDLGFPYPNTAEALPREVRATIKLILKRYMALRTLINQLQRFDSSGLNFDEDLKRNGIVSFDGLVSQVKDLQDKIFRLKSTNEYTGEVIDSCKASTVAQCKNLLKSIDKRIESLTRSYPLIRNNIQL